MLNNNLPTIYLLFIKNVIQQNHDIFISLLFQT